MRENCDYLCLQPIFSKTQRDTLYDMLAGTMEKAEWNDLMDQVIIRENLPGNTAQEPKKKVRIMVCANFEDTANPEEKFYHWSPVPLDMLEKFKLCHPKYWKESNNAQSSLFGKQDKKPPKTLMELENDLGRL